MPVSGALENLYRQIEAGEVDVLEVPEAKDDIPPALGLYFGAQVGWSRDREDGSKLDVEWACDVATRKTLVVMLCPTCLSGYGDIKLADRVVCAGCLRCSQDERIKAILAEEYV